MRGDVDLSFVINHLCKKQIIYAKVWIRRIQERMEKLHLKLGEVMEEAASAAALTRRSLNASREKEAASEAFFRRVCQRDNTGRQPNDKDARQKFY